MDVEDPGGDEIRIAARVAKGRSLSRATAGINSTRAPAAARLATWVRPEAETTAAVRGGLRSPERRRGGRRRHCRLRRRGSRDSRRPLCALVGERAARRRRLADDHQGDDAGDRRDRTQRRPGQPVQPEVRRAVGHRTQDHHPVGVQLQRGDEDHRANQPDDAPGSRRSARSATTTTVNTPTPMPSAHPLIKCNPLSVAPTRCSVLPPARGGRADQVAGVPR